MPLHCYRRCGVVGVLLLTSSTAWAQSTDNSGYYPLDLGSTWTYFQVLDPPYAPPDTSWGGTYQINESVSVNDTLYVISAHPFSLADTLRSDAQGRIWARVDGRDALLFDFTLTEGETYPFRSSGQPDSDLRVSIERNRTADVGAGQFDDVVVFLFDDPQSVDEERTYAFAPGVGIVYAYGTVGDYAELFSAEVDGEVITAIEYDTEPSAANEQGYAYPNPFGNATTVVLPYTGSRRASASVYNALGGKVASLPAADCDTRRCVFEWNGLGLPNGLYYVRLDQEPAQATKVVLVR